MSASNENSKRIISDFLLQLAQLIIGLIFLGIYPIGKEYEVHRTAIIGMFILFLCFMGRFAFLSYEYRADKGRMERVRELPRWFLPLHLSLFMLPTVLYLVLESIITGRLIFLEPQLWYLFIPVAVFYVFVTDFRWRGVFAEPKLHYELMYVVTGTILVLLIRSAILL